jgi:hypothetical protein
MTFNEFNTVVPFFRDPHCVGIYHHTSCFMGGMEHA